MKHPYRLLLFVFTLSFLRAQNVEKINSAFDWQDNFRDYRTFISVEGNGRKYTEKPVEFDINFTELLQIVSDSNPFDINSLRIIEVSETLELIDSLIVFQFDPDSDYNALSKASGKFIFLMKDTLDATSKRYYHVYFDAGSKSYPPKNFSSLLSYTDNVPHEGQSSIKIQSSGGVYYYHKSGAGFASVEDINGNDWVGYSSSTTNLSYRGIPNLGTWAHPGYTNSTSSVVSSGPLKITIESATNDNLWKLIWEVFPDYARMTITKSGGKYWFLYEGVPGGSWNYTSDYVVRNNAIRTLVSSSWTTYELADPEWVYFGDNSTKRTLFFAKHDNDTYNDYYRPLNTNNNSDNMTVFGFGRKDPYSPTTSLLLSEENSSFTFGFYEDSVFTGVREGIESAVNNPTVDLSPAPLLLSVRFFLQGAYAGDGSMTNYLNQLDLIPAAHPYDESPWNYSGTETSTSIPSNTVDWILVELRRSTDSGSAFMRTAAFLRNDGYLTNPDGSYPLEIKGTGDSDFYLVVKHRNHLGVMSADAITKNASLYESNFTAGGSAYGTNPMNLHADGNYMLKSGDGDGSGYITSPDNSIWRMERGTGGYKRADFNLTGDVTAGDRNLHWRKNNGQVTQIP